MYVHSNGTASSPWLAAAWFLASASDDRSIRSWMPATAKVRQLFSIYATNLKLHGRGGGDEVVCPVCGLSFGRTVLDAAGACVLSEGHIFPESMGGKEVTIECRTCNNDLGSEIDASLSNEMKWTQFRTESGRRAAKLTAGGHTRPVTVERKGGETTIHEAKKSALPGSPDPKKVEQLFEGQWSLTFDTKYNPGKVSVALFHCGLLMLFRLFGYEYALSPGGLAVAKWVSARELPMGIAAAHVELPIEVGGVLKDMLLAVAFVGECRCFAICVPGPDSTLRRAVLLPAFDANDLEAFQKEFNGQAGTKSLRVRQVAEHPPVEELANDAFADVGRWILERACE